MVLVEKVVNLAIVTELDLKIFNVMPMGNALYVYMNINIFFYLYLLIFIHYIFFLSQCLTNVEGRRCDRCKENKHNRQNGCIDCPDCYNLVQSAVDKHRQRLSELENTLKKINSSPTVIKDSDFEKELKNVQNKVKNLLDIAKQESGSKYKFIYLYIHCFLI